MKGRTCPWLTPAIKKTINEKDKLLRKARKTKSPNDWQQFKITRNRCNNVIRYAKRHYHCNLLQENRNKPRKFWKALKSIFPSHKNNTDPTSNVESNKGDAQRFCKFFSNIANELKEKSFPLTDSVWASCSDIPFRTEQIFCFTYVSKIFIEKELKTLNVHKATGIDDLPCKLIRDCAEVISKPLAYIVNLSLRSGVIPKNWKVALVKPLHKSGNKESPDNYRPISVLPVLSKVLEKVVHNQLSQYLESNDLLSDKQFGYRKNRSTELATTLLIDNIRKAADAGKMTGAVFIDLSKAFDTLGHATILAKLRSYGIRGNALNWFTNYLFQRTQIVFINGELSDPLPVLCGVPQGSLLGPLLFLIFFNDFAEVCINSDSVLFADDSILYASANNIAELENKLNEDLQKVSNYFRDNELIINLKQGKTECMLFGTAQRLAKCKKGLHLFYNNTKIHPATNYKYLGTILDSTLILQDQFEKVYKTASSRLRLLNKLKSFLTNDAIKLIYTSFVQSLLRFNCLSFLNITETRRKMLRSLDTRAKCIVNNPSINTIDMYYKHAVRTVKKCLDGLSCSNFNSYFTRSIHRKSTRNSGHMLVIPRVKLEFAKSGFYFQGVKIFNSLPLEIRQISSSAEFDTRLMNFQFTY